MKKGQPGILMGFPALPNVMVEVLLRGTVSYFSRFVVKESRVNSSRLLVFSVTPFKIVLKESKLLNR